MDNVLNNLTYGLFVLSCNVEKRDNACIINAAMQVASNPDKIAISVNKSNFTNEMLGYTSDFSLSVISEDAGFSLFQRFGFHSGRDAEKFDGFDECQRVKNGTLIVSKGTNSYISAHIEERLDLGSHILYIATVTEQKILSDVRSASYSYYHEHIKPKPNKNVSGKTVWRCKVCGYEYIGEELPENFICPICKHGASDFEKA